MIGWTIIIFIYFHTIFHYISGWWLRTWATIVGYLSQVLSRLLEISWINNNPWCFFTLPNSSSLRRNLCGWDLNNSSLTWATSGWDGGRMAVCLGSKWEKGNTEFKIIVYIQVIYVLIYYIIVYIKTIYIYIYTYIYLYIYIIYLLMIFLVQSFSLLSCAQMFSVQSL
jgi:hypothetical protein